MKQEKEEQTNVIIARSGHRWDRDGERCLNCGDKSWYADKFCSMSKLKKEEIQAVIDVCKRWLKHIEQQKQDTATLQKAASLARKGDRDEALRLKEQVDNQPRVFDGANFEDVMPTILSALEAQLDDG